MTVRIFIPVVLLTMLSSCSDPASTDGTSNPFVASFDVSRTVHATATAKTITDDAQATLTTTSSAAGVHGGDVSLSGTSLIWTGSSYENRTPAGDRSELHLVYDGRFLVFTVSGCDRTRQQYDCRAGYLLRDRRRR